MNQKVRNLVLGKFDLKFDGKQVLGCQNNS